MTPQRGLWKRARAAGRRHRLWLLPFGVAVVFGCLGSIDATEEFATARGRPVERAVVASVEPDGSWWGCGKFDDHAVIGWRGATLAAVGLLGTWLLLGARVVLAAVVGRPLPSRGGRHRAGHWGGEALVEFRSNV